MASAAFRKGSKCSSMWSKAPRAGRPRTSKASKPLCTENSIRGRLKSRPLYLPESRILAAIDMHFESLLRHHYHCHPDRLRRQPKEWKDPARASIPVNVSDFSATE